MNATIAKAAKPPKPNRLQKLQAEQPWCVYCGMTNRGTTIDHMPPIAMFDMRQRPQGLEFLACDPCNHGSKGLDQLMSLLTRSYPDADTPEAKVETRQLMTAVSNNFPGVLEEMKPSRLQVKRGRRVAKDGLAGVFNASGPIIGNAILRFGAKVGLALHFEKTRSALPPSGGVFVKCYTNYDLFRNAIPSDILPLVGPPRTLRQGRKTTEGYFEYASGTDDGPLVMHYVTFRLSLSYLLFSTADGESLKEAPPGNLFRPGCLKAL